MATDKNRVVAYLSDNEIAELKSLSESWGLSLSKTIVRAVREVCTPSHTVDTPKSVHTETQISEIIDAKVGTLFNQLEGRLLEK